MGGRFNFKCGSCGHTKFTAAGFANDMPSGESEDEWKFQLIFTCDNCSQKVTEVVKKINGETSFEMNFAN